MEVNKKPQRKPQFKKQLPIKIVSNETTNDYKAKTYKEIINFREELNKMNSVGIDKTIPKGSDNKC